MKGPKQKMFVGDKFKTNKNGICEIIEYNGIYDILVRFEDGTPVRTHAGLLNSGKVKNPMKPRIFGRGFIGMGKYSSGTTGNITKEYNTWMAMMARCYDTKNQLRSYFGCEVSKEWFNFQNFAEWCNNQSGFGLKDWQLDKDLLTEGNKLYSPQTCCFLPRALNVLFRTKRSTGNPDMPRGVALRAGRYVATSSVDGNPVSLGSYGDKASAFEAVRLHVNKKIHCLAELHKENLLQGAYDKLKSFDYKPYG